MKSLWETLSRELGPSFKTQYGHVDGDTFKYWEKDLSCFSSQELMTAFNKFKDTDDTFISLKLFRNLCKTTSEDLGLPSLHDTYRAVVFSNWGALPESFKVLFAKHAFSLKQINESEALKMFKPIYEDAIKRISKGEVLKIPDTVRIERQPVENDCYEKPKKKATAEELSKKGNQSMSKLMNSFGKFGRSGL